ncbi:MAG: YkvA family protein [Gudongella sp.]|jgi:uncharacterized membrane protein YkvA (DUF1232 family)|nr:YkvA family protein [Gudongella sp.]
MKIQPKRILYNLKAKAIEYYNNPEKLKGLLENTNLTIKDNTQLGNLIEDIQLVMSLVVDYTKKRYRSVPKSTIITIIAGLVYLANPMDIIPDFLFGGFIDDAAVIGYLLTKIKDELDKYKDWKQL